MLRIVVLVVLLAIAANAQIRVSPICKVPDISGPGDDLQLNVDPSESETVTEETAKKLLDSDETPVEFDGSDCRVKRSTVNEVRQGLFFFNGPIISYPPKPKPCPPLLTTTNGPQELCPSTKEVMYTVRSRDFCFILFPLHKPVTQTRCLCRSCRVNCPLTTPGYRYRCVRENKFYYTYRWAICYRRTGMYLRYLRLRVYNSECNCKSYYWAGCFPQPQPIDASQLSLSKS